MAGKKQQSAEGSGSQGVEDEVIQPNGEQMAEDDVDLSGFSNAIPEEARAWWVKKEGAVAFGEYLGRYEKGWEKPGPDGEGKFYHQIRLWRPTIAAMTIEDAEKAKVEVLGPAMGKNNKPSATTVLVKLPMGKVVNFDESKMLDGLKGLSESGGKKWLIHLKALTRREIKGGKSLWQFDVKKKEFTEADSPF